MSDKGKRNIGQEAARASWLLFILAGIASNIAKSGAHPALPFIALGLVALGFGCGCGGFAVLRRYGSKGILVPALIGVLLNGGVLAVAYGAFTRTLAAQRAQAEQRAGAGHAED